MHARKLPRISEPSFDKDYKGYSGGGGSSSKRSYRRSVTPERYSRSSLRRSYDSRNSRNVSESKKRSSTPTPSLSNSKLKTVGDWSEHLSSSKRKYYYNCVTEVSQWEKPREWNDFERSRKRSRKTSRDVTPTSEESGGMTSVSGEMNSSASNNNTNNNNNNTNNSSLHHHHHHHNNHHHHHNSTSSSCSFPLNASLPELSSHPRLSSESELSTSDALKTITSVLLFSSNAAATAAAAAVTKTSITSPYSGPPTPTRNEEPSDLPSSSSTSSSLSQISKVIPSPSLTPNLFKYYKESLVGHVTAWPAESLEKTCQRLNEEHVSLSNLGITKVSAELKMARSLVRLAEIQATLQEQRILFLRQQSLDLENLKSFSELESNVSTESIVK